MKHLFSENRLIYRLATDFIRTSAGTPQSAVAALQQRDRTLSRNVTNYRVEIAANARAQQNAVNAFNTTAAANGSPFSRSRLGGFGSDYKDTRGLLPVGLFQGEGDDRKIVGTQYFSQSQKQNALREQKRGAAVEAVSSAENAARARGDYDDAGFAMARAAAEQAVSVELARGDAVDQSKAKNRAAQRSAGKIETPQSRSAGMGIRPFGNRTSAAGKAANAAGGVRGQGSSQGGYSSPTGGDPTKPVIQPTKTGVSQTIPARTQSSQEAADALSGGDIEAPGSLKGIVAEEQAAILPSLEAAANIRGQFSILNDKLGGLFSSRANAINTYKSESKATAREIADAKIEQSKANQDLELEIAEESRDRQERDEKLINEKNIADLDKREAAQRQENADKIERARTSLGARYGGFGSGKGLQVIRDVEAEGEQLLNEITESKIYERRVHANKLGDIATDFRNDRRKVFNEHDKAVTEAYNKMQEAFMTIDEKGLDEEGEMTDKAIDQLRESFNTFERIELNTADKLTEANQRALTRRDDVRKEKYQMRQDTIQNVFSGVGQLGSAHPFLKQFEEELGMTPGTLASMKTPEERKIAISLRHLQIAEEELGLSKGRYRREGYEVNETLSNSLGMYITKDLQVMRDPAGNPIRLTDGNGTLTGNSGHDRMLYGSDAIDLYSTANFSQWALQHGNLVPGSPYHKGGEYDIDNKAGTPITPFMGGEVTETGTSPGLGNFVKIRDKDNRTWTYAHLQGINVEAGQQVEGFTDGSANFLGTMGNSGNVMGMDGQRPGADDHETGSHLHFQVTDADGKLLDPMSLQMQAKTDFAGKVSWVDDQRKRFYGDGSTPWNVVDQSIVEYAKDVFKDKDGKLNTRALDTVIDYINDHPMGGRQYAVSYDPTPQMKGAQAVVSDMAQTAALEDMLVSTVTQRISQGADPLDLLDDLQGETKIGSNAVNISYDMVKEALLRAGYEIDDGWLWDKANALTPTQKEEMNRDRKAKGLPLIQ